LQAGALSINRSDVDMNLLVRRIAARLATQSEIHEIVVDFPDDLPVILADEDRLTQVFTNLISNAIKYSPKGGEIRIEGNIRPHQVIICVSDEGPGIAASDIPYIFDRFYRSADASRKTKGAGLGLYLARAIVEAHGGRIWADPKPGAGARICFSLPRDDQR
jgi:signal transduction histidine kinase